MANNASNALEESLFLLFKKQYCNFKNKHWQFQTKRIINSPFIQRISSQLQFKLFLADFFKNECDYKQHNCAITGTVSVL